MNITDIAILPTIGIGLFVLRIVLGLYMAAHGAQKLFGWFRGYGLAGTAGAFEKMGFRPGHLFAVTAAASEVVSGLLVTLGLFGPVGPALMISVMIVAMGSVHFPNGFFATQNGIELPFLYAAGAFGLALAGFGSVSVDAALGLTSIWTAPLLWGVLAIGIVGGALNLALRRAAASEVVV